MYIHIYMCVYMYEYQYNIVDSKCMCACMCRKRSFVEDINALTEPRQVSKFERMYFFL